MGHGKGFPSIVAAKITGLDLFFRFSLSSGTAMALEPTFLYCFLTSPLVRSTLLISHSSCSG